MHIEDDSFYKNLFKINLLDGCRRVGEEDTAYLLWDYIELVDNEFL